MAKSYLNQADIIIRIISQWGNSDLDSLSNTVTDQRCSVANAERKVGSHQTLLNGSNKAKR